jgi:methyltransferase (TIGR00027 family)
MDVTETLEKDRRASATALGVARLRAAHMIIDGEPPILADTVIGRLLGSPIEVEARVWADLEQLQAPLARGLRSHVVLRGRVAEDALADAAAAGVTQYLALGAGLDTFAYRQPAWAAALDVIEVDHPASQAAKREALHAAGIAIPPNVRYADIDFERETLADGLRRCGVSTARRALVSWLGVTMYLTRDAIDAVLATVAGFPAGSTLVLTFAQPRDGADPDPIALGAARAGEPWLSYFTPDELAAVLRGHGFADVRFLARDEAFRRYYATRRDGLLPPRRVSLCTAIV